MINKEGKWREAEKLKLQTQGVDLILNQIELFTSKKGPKMHFENYLVIFRNCPCF